MSVTITIANNYQWAVENAAVKTVDYDGVEIKEVPFEFNLANGNFSTLWHSLGLPFDYSGEIDSRRIIKAIKSLDPDLLIRSETQEGNVINCALTKAQAARYLLNLTKICDEAERREEKVVWG